MVIVGAHSSDLWSNIVSKGSYEDVMRSSPHIANLSLIYLSL